MDIISALKRYGLDDKEAAVYLALLELGPSNVHKIAFKTGIKRTTIYLVAEDLMRKNLITEYKDRHGIHYSAEPPDKLLDLLIAKENRIRNLLPELKAIANKEVAKPRVSLLEGKEGILQVCEDTLLVPNSEIKFTGSLLDVYKLISQDYDTKHYIPTRLKKSIRFKMMVFKNETTLAMQKEDSKELRQTRFLPKGVQFTPTQFIYQNKIAYITPEKELVGIIIESEEIAKLERQRFELIWNGLGSKESVK